MSLKSVALVASIAAVSLGMTSPAASPSNAAAARPAGNVIRVSLRCRNSDGDGMFLFTRENPYTLAFDHTIACGEMQEFPQDPYNPITGIRIITAVGNVICLHNDITLPGVSRCADATVIVN